MSGVLGQTRRDRDGKGARQIPTGASVSRLVGTLAPGCAHAGKPNPARRFAARATRFGFGHGGVVAVLLAIVLAVCSSQAAQAAFTISKIVNNPSPNVGDTVTFTVTLDNTGPAAATGVQVTDQLPVGLTFVLATASQGTYTNSTGLWDVGTVNNGANATLTLQALVVSPNAQTNTATITAGSQGVGSSASATVTPQQADLSVAKIVSNPGPNVGDTVTFTITLSNSGPNPATNVTLQDQLPAGLTFVSATASQGSYSSGSGVWTVGTVTTTIAQTLLIQATVVSPNPLTNTATITHSDQFDPNTGNNSASASVSPQQADLAVTKTGPPSAHVGDTFNYVVTLSNSGPSAATNVTLQDQLPVGLTFVSATASQGSYSSGTGAWTVGTIAAGASATLTLQATKTTPLTTTNTATITHSDQFDPNTGNNSAAATTQTATQSAPTLSITTGAPTIPVGGTTSLTFTITNPNGGASLTGVAFTDALPGGLAVATPNGLSGSCGGGTITANAGGGSISLSGGTLAAGGSCTFTVNVTGTAAGVQTNSTSPVTSNEGGIGNSATASITVTGPATNATNITLASSVNPSNVGQPVTFTATVTSSSGTPTGTVTFKDGATVIGTVSLSAGVATFTTAALAAGTHTITASYGGASGFAASTSPALTQTVQIPLDSVRLRALQVAVSKVEALASGAAFEGAVAGAIAEGFAEGGGALMTPSENGVRFNLTADPDNAGRGERVAEQYDAVLAARSGAMRDNSPSAINQNLPASVRSFAPDPSQAGPAGARVDNAFNELAYAKTPPPVVKVAPPREWLVWADVRGTGWNTDPSAGDIRGAQVNAIAGLTRKLTPDFLLGALAGYENFDYTSQTLNGRLRGNGWTMGGYLGWRILPGVRFDAAIGRSGITYDGVSGAASATFPGNRWLASAGLTGTYRTEWLLIEPSAKVYAVWERDFAYVDSLGTLQPENTFSSGRASAGGKVAYPIAWDAIALVAPYVGLYADYYFSSDNAALLLPTQFVHGWAARTTAGVSYNFAGGTRVLFGGEVGGLGSQNFTVWSVRGRASVPF